MDAMRSASAAFARSGSDSGSGGEGSSGDDGCGEGGGPAQPGSPQPEAQRMLLEAVLALMGQVEAGQLSMVSRWGGSRSRPA
jgi:hypothetical protein